MGDELLEDLLNSPPGDNLNLFEEEDVKLAPLIDEINLIEDQAVRFFVRTVLMEAGLFWVIPAGRTHHPPDEQTEGGNVLHTKRVVRIVWLMCESQQRSTYETDIIIAAALLHDLTKGIVLGDEVGFDPMHPYTVDQFVQLVCRKDEEDLTVNRSSTFYLAQEEGAISQILRLVRCHMGPWSPVFETIPLTTPEWILHWADYIAANLHHIIDGPDYDVRRWILDE